VQDPDVVVAIGRHALTGRLEVERPVASPFADRAEYGAGPIDPGESRDRIARRPADVIRRRVEGHGRIARHVEREEPTRRAHAVADGDDLPADGGAVHIEVLR
jgi:hypothetical protein